MKKIININFHGRVIPIEESAYELLTQYVESLRRYFAKEEGKDEIINDIENRFAELFSERLKNGAACITDEHVNGIIASMGRPEDFDEEEIATGPSSAGIGSGPSQQQAYTEQQNQQSYIPAEPRRLFRSENDKILGGVCAGLANYLRLDPAVVRIIFALVTFGGFGLGLLLYIILWIAVPSKSLALNVRKRLYRNPENKVIAGVASGLAAYFHMEVWIPRLIFSLPLILGIITSIFRNAWFDFDPGPAFVTGGFGGTLFITYIILWIVLPEATSASEKLEMRGEKVDLESIKNTIKSDLEGFRGRAKDMGGEVKERAQQFGQEFKQATQNFTNEAAPIARRTGSGFGHAIGVLFKAFFLFIAGVIAFALMMALIGLLFSGVGVFPFKDYVLSGFWQNFLAWCSLFLFLAIPLISLIVWLIRRIMGARSRSHYLGYIFGSLWVIGLICFITLIVMISRNFRNRRGVEHELSIAQPVNGKVWVKVSEGNVKYYGTDWFGFDDEREWPFFSYNEDSLMIKTVRVSLEKSPDSSFHIYEIKISRGNSPQTAENSASRINFNPQFRDSVLYLPKGFSITQDAKFRNQQVVVRIEIPVGKKIEVDRSIEFYKWFNVNFGNRRYYQNDWDDDWNNSYNWNKNVEYIMMPDGLVRTGKNKDGDNDEGDDEQPVRKHKANNGYRYKSPADSTPATNHKDTTTHKNIPAKPKQEAPTAAEKGSTSVHDTFLAALIQM